MNYEKEESLIQYFHVFGSTGYILANREYHRKWDVKLKQGIFLRYSQNSRAYRVFYNRSETVMETINVVVNDSEPTAKRTNDEDDEVPKVTVVFLLLLWKHLKLILKLIVLT